MKTQFEHGRAIMSGNRPLAASGALSLAAYWWIAVGLEHAGGAREVWWFLGTFGGLFAIYFLAIALVWPRCRGNPGPAATRAPVQIIVWAVLFRLALLPAGLPIDSWTEDLAADLCSRRIAYRSFLLYDNDVWRYLWDGRAVASGVSLAVTMALVAWTFRRDDGSTRRLISGSFLILGGFLITSAAVMPWYLLWVLPLAALRAGSMPAAKSPEVFAWIALTALSLLSYLIYVDQIEHHLWLWVEYLGFFGVLAWQPVAKVCRGHLRKTTGR